MYKSFEIHNFKCFRELKLDKLARINLIAGMNNVGKTALLEAIFLNNGIYNQELFLRLSHIRGVEFLNLTPQSWDEYPFSSFFYKFNISDSIELLSEDTITGYRSTQVNVSTNSTSTEPAIILKLEHKEENRSIVYNLTISNGSISFGPVPSIDFGSVYNSPPFPIFETIFYDSKITIDPQQQAEIYGKLQIVGKENDVWKILKLIEPRLIRIASIATARNSMLYGDIGIGHFVPLHLMGEGMVHLANFVLKIANTSNKVILIDEIENGLHYSVMTNVWKAIASTAKEYNTQVFATTHSWECVLAAHEAFESSETYDSDFQLHRLDRLNDDDIKVVTYNKRSLTAAIKAGLEVR